MKRPVRVERRGEATVAKVVRKVERRVTVQSTPEVVDRYKEEKEEAMVEPGEGGGGGSRREEEGKRRVARRAATCSPLRQARQS